MHFCIKKQDKIFDILTNSFLQFKPQEDEYIGKVYYLDKGFSLHYSIPSFYDKKLNIKEAYFAKKYHMFHKKLRLLK